MHETKMHFFTHSVGWNIGRGATDVEIHVSFAN